MTVSDDGEGGRPTLSAERISAYRRSSTRRPLRVQIEQLLIDLENASVLAMGGDPVLARGAALAAAHAALKLAVTSVVEEQDRCQREQLLRTRIVPALVRSGLGHVAPLIAAALAHDGDPAACGRGVETAQ